MKKLHVKIEGSWKPVFCNNGGKIITCENDPNKALGKNALAYFQDKFANHEFALITI